MSAPRTKRQFAGAASDPAQRQITSFFNQGPASLGTSSSSCPTIRAPALPPNIQSNLLSVGMRVRKSVPEGYKTGNNFSGFSLWADSDNTNRLVPAVGSAPLETKRELLPFCGINKVGGLATQPSFDLPPLPDVVFSSTAPTMDDIPSLTSSQESVESTASSIAMAASAPSATNRKRVFAEDDAGDMPAVSDRLQVWRNDWLDGEVSPRSLAPVGWENARVMAVPRRRSARKAGGGAGRGNGAVALASLGQENMALDDFDDAEFLDYQSWGGDMDMSGA